IRFMSPESTGLEFTTSLKNDIPFYSDKNRIRVILGNLVSNAIQYRDRKKEKPLVDITINLSAQQAEIIVTDNGIGIAKENHEKVFEMFRRVSKMSNGSGLGLYIVMETVQKLNG